MKKYLFIAIFLLFNILQIQNSNAQVAAQDSLALVNLYNSTNGPGWTNKSNWLIGVVRTWSGVKISSNRVTDLVLHDNQMYGNIPSSLGNLSSLVNLQLDGNQIQDTIPSSLGNLLNLKSLYLNRNQLIGSIPSAEFLWKI